MTKLCPSYLNKLISDVSANHLPSSVIFDGITAGFENVLQTEMQELKNEESTVGQFHIVEVNYQQLDSEKFSGLALVQQALILLQKNNIPFSFQAINEDLVKLFSELTAMPSMPESPGEPPVLEVNPEQDEEQTTSLTVDDLYQAIQDVHLASLNGDLGTAMIEEPLTASLNELQNVLTETEIRKHELEELADNVSKSIPEIQELSTSLQSLISPNNLKDSLTSPICLAQIHDCVDNEFYTQRKKLIIEIGEQPKQNAIQFAAKRFFSRYNAGLVNPEQALAPETKLDLIKVDKIQQIRSALDKIQVTQASLSQLENQKEALVQRCKEIKTAGRRYSVSFFGHEHSPEDLPSPCECKRSQSH